MEDQIMKTHLLKLLTICGTLVVVGSGVSSCSSSKVAKLSYQQKHAISVHNKHFKQFNTALYCPAFPKKN